MFPHNPVGEVDSRKFARCRGPYFLAIIVNQVSSTDIYLCICLPFGFFHRCTVLLFASQLLLYIVRLFCVVNRSL